MKVTVRNRVVVTVGGDSGETETMLGAVLATLLNILTAILNFDVIRLLTVPFNEVFRGKVRGEVL